MTFIVIHRIACLNLTAAQIQARAWTTFGGVFVAILLVSTESLPIVVPVMQAGGVLLSASALMGLAMSFYNQTRRAP